MPRGRASCRWPSRRRLRTMASLLGVHSGVVGIPFRGGRVRGATSGPTSRQLLGSPNSSRTVCLPSGPSLSTEHRCKTASALLSRVVALPVVQNTGARRTASPEHKIGVSFLVHSAVAPTREKRTQQAATARPRELRRKTRRSEAPGTKTRYAPTPTLPAADQQQLGSQLTPGPAADGPVPLPPPGERQRARARLTNRKQRTGAGRGDVTGI